MKAIFERSYPYLGGVAAAIALTVYANPLARQLAAAEVRAIEIFSSVFDAATLLTGLLFSVYVLAIAPGGGFIERIFSTKTFALFRRYVKEAMGLGAAASLLSMPLRALQDLTLPIPVNWHALVVMWGFAAVGTGLAFWRVVHAFFIFARADAGRRRAA